MLTYEEKSLPKSPTFRFDLELEEFQEVLFLLKEKEAKNALADKLIEKFNAQSSEKLDNTPMSYKQFSIDELIEKFALEEKQKILFENVNAIPCPEELKSTLERNKLMPLKSEKSRGEMIIAPIMVELLNQYKGKISIFSGERLNVDEAKGLVGELDYLFCNYTSKLRVMAPVFALVEAKKGDLEMGYAQCVAQMIGAREFNKQKQVNIPTVYGCVTSGKVWQFFALESNTLYVDTEEYYLIEIDKLLGIFQHIINEFLSTEKYH